LGVNAITGEGLTEALDGAQVVVDVANAPAWDDAAVLDFFQTSSRNLLASETAAGVGHHVTLSVVGADRLASPIRPPTATPFGCRLPSFSPRQPMTSPALWPMSRSAHH
jgi:uncharacterized protein YbjT (DUF2867 family)